MQTLILQSPQSEIRGSDPSPRSSNRQVGRVVSFGAFPGSSSDNNRVFMQVLGKEPLFSKAVPDFDGSLDCKAFGSRLQFEGVPSSIFPHARLH